MDRQELLNDSENSLRLALDGRQAQIWTALPAIVQSVNFVQMTVQAQPAIQGVVTDQNGNETFVNLPLLVDVPVCFPSAGGFSLTLPIKAGDEVLVLLASRCIDSWWYNGGIGVPVESRMHDLSDGFAIPGPRSLPRVVSGISPTSAQLRNDAGTSYIELTAAGGINLVSPTGVTVTGPLNLTGALNIDGSPFTSHKHLGVQTGSGISGVPV